MILVIVLEISTCTWWLRLLASFTKEANWQLTERPLKTMDVYNLWLTSLVKEAMYVY